MIMEGLSGYHSNYWSYKVYGYPAMLPIPSQLAAEFEDCLRKKAIPKVTHGF